jgi:pimeloyl-ACP methyl ester carboxylesterase
MAYRQYLLNEDTDNDSGKVRMRSLNGTSEKRVEPPHLFFAFAELPRALLEFVSLLPAHPLVRNAPGGDGHPVITLPGFRGNDTSMNVLRRYLEHWGYDPHPWGLGTNLGIGFDRVYYERRFLSQLERVARRRGQPVSIIGWSQGGVIARQAAKRRPELVRQVITLGSPIGDSPEATTIWRIFERTSEQEITPELMAYLKEVASPVPQVRCTCVYSRSDGIVSPDIAQDQVSPLAENICVTASHFGMGVNPSVLLVIADRLAQKEPEWKPFDARGFRRILARKPV